MGDEGSLLSRLRVYLDLPVTGHQIPAGEVLGTSQGI